MELKKLKHLETLKGKVPLKELQYLVENKEEVTDELLQIIDYTVENGEKLSEEGSFILHIIAMHTLAYFREKRAYSDIISIAKLPPDIIGPLLEDTITEGLAGIIASVFDGDLAQIQEIIDNSECDEFVRRAAIRSIVALVENNIVGKDEVITYFKEHSSGDNRSENVISILENDEMYQEDHFISKEDVLGLSRWLGSY